MEGGFLPGTVAQGAEKDRSQFQVCGYFHLSDGHRFQTRVVQISEKHLADDFPDQVTDAMRTLVKH
jgi:hypothetical protein